MSRLAVVPGGGEHDQSRVGPVLSHHASAGLGGRAHRPGRRAPGPRLGAGSRASNAEGRDFVCVAGDTVAHRAGRGTDSDQQECGAKVFTLRRPGRLARTPRRRLPSVLFVHRLSCCSTGVPERAVSSSGDEVVTDIHPWLMGTYGLTAGEAARIRRRAMVKLRRSGRVERLKRTRAAGADRRLRPALRRPPSVRCADQGGRFALGPGLVPQPGCGRQKPVDTGPRHGLPWLPM
jgi:hypothetical protein